MPTCADAIARTLREAGVTRAFGLPGGEVLDVVDALRRAGIEFLLTRHEATASLMADVTGQLSGVPGVCVSTLGPGAVNMTLGVANAFLERSPVIAITAAHATTAAPYATHQKLDLNAVYRPFTKLAITFDGHDTASKVRRAIDVSLTPRRGPVHLALPSDIARRPENGDTQHFTKLNTPVLHQRQRGSESATGMCSVSRNVECPRFWEAMRGARGAVAILGLDLDPRRDVAAVREFVEALQLPTFESGSQTDLS